MRDESYDRDIRYAREHLSRELSVLGEAIGNAFATLARIRFDAPWRHAVDRSPKTCP